MILGQSFTNIFLIALIAAGLASIALFIGFLWYGKRTTFYRDSKKDMGSVERTSVMIIYVIIASLVSFFSFYFFMLLFSWIVSLLRI
jgi:uncharacterized membrane protein SpoIIM required for sporulation